MPSGARRRPLMAISREASTARNSRNSLLRRVCSRRISTVPPRKFPWGASRTRIFRVTSCLAAIGSSPYKDSRSKGGVERLLEADISCLTHRKQLLRSALRSQFTLTRGFHLLSGAERILCLVKSDEFDVNSSLLSIFNRLTHLSHNRINIDIIYCGRNANAKYPFLDDSVGQLDPAKSISWEHIRGCVDMLLH